MKPLPLILTIFLLSPVLPLTAQNNAAVLLQSHPYKITLFEACHPASQMYLPDTICDDPVVWRPTPYEILETDKRFKKIIRDYKPYYTADKGWRKVKENRIIYRMWQKEKSRILRKPRRYNRIYEVALNDIHRKVLRIHCACYYAGFEVDPNKPDEEVQYPMGGGTCYLHIAYDYDQKKTLDIIVHAPR